MMKKFNLDRFKDRNIIFEFIIDLLFKLWEIYIKLLIGVGSFFFKISKKFPSKSEPSDSILENSMEDLCSFIEGGKYDIIDWCAFPEHFKASKQILQIYYYWRYERTILLEKYEKEMDKLILTNNSISKTLGLDWNQKALKKIKRLETEIYYKDQRYLYMLVNIRRYL